MIRTMLAAGALLLGVTAVTAEAVLIPRRKELMKNIGGATKDPGAMLKGEQGFDIAKVHAALRTYVEGTQHLPDLFPPHSLTGDTAALPAIAESPDKFQAIFVKLRGDAQAALAAIKDEASFKAEFPKVLQNCGACHNSYRRKST